MEGTDPPAHVATTVVPPKSRVGMRIAIVVTIGLLVALGVLVGQKVKEALAKREAVAAERKDVAAAATKRPAALATHPVPTTWRAKIEMTGTLKPWRDADVGFETGGRLLRVAVAVGDVVKAGQMLALLDGTRASEAVAMKDAAVRAARGNVMLQEDAARRAVELAKSGAIPDAHADQARLQAELAHANLAAAQADADYTRTGVGQHAVSAPFAGVVTRAPTAAGGVVQAGAPLIHIEDLSRLRLSATVGEEDVPLVHLGAPVKVTYREREVTGKVVAMVPSLDQTTRRAPVEIEVPNDPAAPLLAWSFVRAQIAGDADIPAFRLPDTARRPGSQDELVKVERGKARIVRVAFAVGADGTWIVRSAALTAGDVVLLAPDGQTKDGDPVAETEIQGASSPGGAP